MYKIPLGFSVQFRSFLYYCTILNCYFVRRAFTKSQAFRVGTKKRTCLVLSKLFPRMLGRKKGTSESPYGGLILLPLICSAYNAFCVS